MLRVYPLPTIGPRSIGGEAQSSPAGSSSDRGWCMAQSMTGFVFMLPILLHTACCARSVRSVSCRSFGEGSSSHAVMTAAQTA